MKYYYSLLEGLILIFNLDHNRKWSHKIICAKRKLKKYGDIHVIIDLLGGKGKLNDHVLFRKNFYLKYLGQAWFEELCCYILKASNILLEKKKLTFEDIIQLHDEEEKRIYHNKKLGEKYSKERSLYYDYQGDVNDLILKGLEKNNIETVILKNVREK